MRSYTKEDILAIYHRLMQIAYDYVENGKWRKAISYLSSASKWAYDFNYFYMDDKAEALIKRLSDKLIEPISINSSHNDRCVLIDSFCLDNRGLTQQYLRAMMYNEMDILYICTSHDLKNGEDILFELRKYPKAKLLLFDTGNLDPIWQANKIVEEVLYYSPSHVFLHIAPWDVMALMACKSINGATIYNINLTDHAYWMGTSLIDYNIEFRPYGMTVSLEKRNLKSEQLLGLPFYPIVPVGHFFKGFPEMADDSVKIFTGGALYKFLGKNDIFFRIMEMLLAISPNVYILIAGFEPNKLFNEKCRKIENNNRILQLGFRDDIDSVFQHCDVYLSTYPTSGGLMTQYAAKYGKPILAYRDIEDVENAVEEMLNHYGNGYKSCTDLHKFQVYASKLIKEEDFRKSEGDSLKEGLMTPKRFAESFSTLVYTHVNPFHWHADTIDYDAFSDHYLDLENTNGFMASRYLLMSQKIILLLKLKGYERQFLSCLIDILWSILLMRFLKPMYSLFTHQKND